MSFFHRSYENPIVVPQSDVAWQAEGAFNGSVWREKGKTHIVYRAQSLPLLHDEGPWLSMSSIGYSQSTDGIHFQKHTQLIAPEEKWERFGCEDPRITKIDDTYFIFYTALSVFPFSADGIRVGVALTKDLRHIDERHPVTPFNAKAMALFPEKIDGKYYALLTPDTDMPPAKIALASFSKIEDMWNPARWKRWHDSLEKHTLKLSRNDDDQVEFGAPPLKTKEGWLILYSYIRNYRSGTPLFTVEAALLDLRNPSRIIGRTTAPLFVPEEEYELYGKVPDVVFPTGATIDRDTLMFYYGAADTTTCVATASLSKLLKELTTPESKRPVFKRSRKNPLLEPITEHDWEAKAVFNPAVITHAGRTHLLYRATSPDDTSTLGYASFSGIDTLESRLSDPVYTPRLPFEQKSVPGNSGCEDPRITILDGTVYLFYTAVDPAKPPRVALSTISEEDFFAQRFDRFSLPILISPPGIDDKDACLFPEKINGKYYILHRIQPSIDINSLTSLDFDGSTKFLAHRPFLFPRRGMWDSKKIGINTVPIKTASGWLIIYHGVSDTGVYSLGAFLLDLKHPEKLIGRSRYPIFTPDEPYERIGVVPNVVFPCGACVIGQKLVIYYGGADRVIGAASIRLTSLIASLKA